jgi:hypothetical protein
MAGNRGCIGHAPDGSVASEFLWQSAYLRKSRETQWAANTRSLRGLEQDTAPLLGNINPEKVQ